MSFPFDEEPADRLYVKHAFTSSEEAADFPYLTKEEQKQCKIRGWRCAICGQTKPECESRNEHRPKTMGTDGLRDNPEIAHAT